MDYEKANYIKLPHKCGKRKEDFMFTFKYNNGLRQARKDAFELANQMWCDKCFTAINYIPWSSIKKIAMIVYIK